MFRHKLGFEGPTDLFLKRASKSLIRLCLRAILSKSLVAAVKLKFWPIDSKNVFNI